MTAYMYELKSGEFMREATREEYEASIAAEEHDGGVGAIEADGTIVYVIGHPSDFAPAPACVYEIFDTTTGESLGFESAIDRQAAIEAYCSDTHALSGHLYAALVDVETAAAAMDEELYLELCDRSWWHDAEFLNAYSAAHIEKFGEQFVF